MEPKPAAIIKGEAWWNFIYGYDFEGSAYQFTVMARSAEEANARMKKIALARFVGQADGGPRPLMLSGWAVPLIVWWRNFNIWANQRW